jgi:predicted metal-dependent HD superfamily phosphohydrolase
MNNKLTKDLAQLIIDIPKIYSQNDKELKYHNSKHISDFIDKFINTEYINKIDENNIYYFLIAIVYHDSVYDVYDINFKNESKSSSNFYNSKHFYNLFYKKDDENTHYKYIEELIMCTKYGAVHDTVDKKVMHDIDYSGFANQCRFRYLQTQFDIIDEFLIPHHVLLSELIPKRVNFLEHLDSTKIYYFDDVFNEEIAHNNINFEIEFWKNFKG